MNIINPFFIYLFSFTLVFLLYSFRLSELYPKIGIDTLLFFIFTFLISIFYGFLVRKHNLIKFKKIDESGKERFVVILLYVGFALECLYNRGIPLLMVTMGYDYYYKDFGIPTFHILYITFLSFYTLNLFHKYISYRKKMLLIYFLICNTIPILMYYRSLSVFIFIGSLFIFLFSNEKKKVKNKTKIQLVLIVSVFFYLFGILGNIRVNSQIQNGKSAFDSEVILNVGRASDIVRDHELLSPFFWTYLYSTVSLANFQYNINRYRSNNINPNSFLKFYKNELVYDFLSKRLWTEEKIDHDLIREDLTTTTMFTNSFIALGWLGPLLIFAHIIFLFMVLIFFSPRDNDYFVTGMAILCSLILLGTFENMFSYSAFGFTFIYPILFSQLNKLKAKRIKPS